MPPKTSKITDIAGPGETAPSATSRPLLVENRSVIPNDPMLVGAAADAPVASVSASRHSEKVLAPMTDGVQTADDAPAPAVPEQVSETPPVAPAEPAPEAPSPESADTPKPTEPETILEPKPERKPAESTVQTFESSAEDTTETDDDMQPDAAADAATAAEEARGQELEKLVESGAYTVPINAVQHHRTHVLEVLLIVFGLILAVALFDAALDSGVLSLSVNIPHTHFLSTK